MATKGPVVEWTVREQLILASAVQRSGDQNWVSVSRAVKPLVEDARPPDYFSQKNCALQYSAMLDKAKHPKRKRSSDGTPETAVTVEEQIVHQLTEKRIKELDSSITDTRKEYLALKEEIEKMEQGELDAELPAMWEKLQTDMAVKEGADTKGSRTRRSSGSSATGSDSDHQKKQKTGGGSTEKSREKSSHRSPDKRSTQPTLDTVVSVMPVVKEEKTVPENPSPLIPTPTTSPSASSTITPIPALPVATQRALLKKRTLETLPLFSTTTTIGGGGGGGGEISFQEDSPILFPMTVPKEEPLRETLAAAGGSLSQSLVLPLSPDMHVIVQQPNIAALTTGSLSSHPPTSTAQASNSGTALEKIDGFQGSVSTPATPAVLMPAVSTAAADTGSTPVPVTTTTTTTTGIDIQPNTSANEELAPTAISPSLTPSSKATTEGPDPSEAVTLLQPQPPRSTGPTTPPPVIPHHHHLSAMSLQRSPLSVSRVGHTTYQTGHVVPRPQLSPSRLTSPIKHHPQMVIQPQPHPPPSPSSPMTVVSTMLSDPRLSSRLGAVRPTGPPPLSNPQQEKDERKAENQTNDDKTKDENPQTLLNQDVMEMEKKVNEETKMDQTQHETGHDIAEVEKTKSFPTDSTSAADTAIPLGTGQTPKKEEERILHQLPSDIPATREKTETPPEHNTDKLGPSLPDPTMSTPTPQHRSRQQTLDEFSISNTPSVAKPQLPSDSDISGKSGETNLSLSQLSTEAKVPRESLPPQPTVELVKQMIKTESSKRNAHHEHNPLPLPSPPPPPPPPQSPLPEIEGDTAGVEKLEEVEGISEEKSCEEKREGSVSEVTIAAAEEDDTEKEELVDVVNPPLEEEKESETGVDGSVLSSESTQKEMEIKPEAMEEEGEMAEVEGSNLDESLQTEAGSSRRSSTSELPSSPITSVKEETAEPEEILPRRRHTKSTTRKLWATRSRKRKLDAEEGMSTDLESEEEPSSIVTSAAPSPAPSQGDGDGDSGMSKKQWKKAIMLVWRHAAQHKYANLFLHPVRDDDAPGYSDVIHRPMDLSTVKRNIENGATTNDTEFQRDVLLMFQNAFMYNSSDHDVYDMAEKMRADVMQSIQDYLNTQLQLIVESSTPKVLRSRDKEGRRMDVHDEVLVTPIKKRRTRADDNVL